MHKPIGGLTPHQVKMLAYLRTYIGANVFAPSYEEICKELGYPSKSGVSRTITELETLRLVKRVKGKMRAIEITAKGMGIRLPEEKSVRA